MDNKDLASIVAQLKADGWEIENLESSTKIKDDLVTINRLSKKEDKEIFETAFFRKKRHVVYINVFDENAFKLIIKLISEVRNIN